MRDPRIDPQPGDILQKGKIQRSVRMVETSDCSRQAVVCCGETDLDEPHGIRHVRPFIRQWRRWAAAAEVVCLPDSKDTSVT